MRINYSYSMGSLLPVRNVLEVSGRENPKETVVTEFDVCEDCRRKRYFHIMHNEAILTMSQEIGF